MHISLAVATIGRKAELAKLLDMLCAQTYTSFDVLICDQNPEGFLQETLAPYEERLRITRVSVKPRGVSAARNALLPYCTGDIVAFPDDDCWYAPNTLEKVVAFFTKHQGVDGMMGIWGDSPQGIEEAKRTFAEEKELSYTELYVRSETYVQFFKLHVVQSVGGFDEKLGPGTGIPYGCGEDTDYILRAHAFTKIWRVPSVHLFHPNPHIQTPDKAKIYAYACGRMYLLRKHKAPLWFVAANVLFPLYRLVVEGPKCWKYRWYMFYGRLKALVG